MASLFARTASRNAVILPTYSRRRSSCLPTHNSATARPCSKLLQRHGPPGPCRCRSSVATQLLSSTRCDSPTAHTPAQAITDGHVTEAMRQLYDHSVPVVKAAVKPRKSR
ncbi:hypothetical protein E4420_13470 [Stenotrophomonas maltophilia]|nr:hypothetical protein [Stenotrophomonas maltophilia]MBA0296000.1 hypothetical protein [Stenotrophomonas maltophilia]MBA0347872.1 hypothetical protein [Stenotrophomonas maltophilia]MBA0443004.1 hypothetical protein [Stenotrophomonas maltophilia]TIL18698.1 hypothetical protein E4420_13470 [Stenotrophomonas maltophilia]